VADLALSVSGSCLSRVTDVAASPFPDDYTKRKIKSTESERG